MRRVELRHLRYAIAVSEELHFGRAAARLNMSQPPLSQQIRLLEEELGVKLFNRTKHKVQLTHAGARFVYEARQAVAQVDHAMKVALEASKGEIGYLRIGTVAAKRQVLMETLRVFAQRCPHVHVDLHTLSTPAQVESLRDGQIQVGFVILPVEEPDLAFETVALESVVIAVPERHPLSARRRVSLKALAGESSVFFPGALSPGYYNRLLAMGQDGKFSLKFVPEIDDIYTALTLVEAGLGICVLPSCVQEFSRSGVVFREFEGVPPMEFAVVYRRESRCPVLQKFLEVVREVGRQGTRS